MSAFYLTFLAVLLSGIGARDQAVVADHARAPGKHRGVLLAALATGFASAGFAAWAGAYVAPLMVPAARLLLAGIALAFAGAEMLFLPAPRAARAPDTSAGALVLVLASHQLTDAARFLVFAVAVATNAPLAAGLGGAAGGAGIVTLGWLLPELCRGRGTRILKRGTGMVLLLAAAAIALRTFDGL